LTGTLYDWLAPAAICKGNGGMALFVALRSLTPGCRSARADDGRSKDQFESIIKQMETSVGRDISASPQSAQAAAVTEWLKRTRPPAGYVVVIEDYADVTVEIERRAGRTVAERFEPLFEKHWRTATATSLSVLWPTQPTEGAVDATKAVAIRLEVCGTADGLTPQAVLSLDGLVTELLPFVTGGLNAVRTTEICKAFKARSDVKAADDISTDAQSQLLLNGAYQSLRTDVSACGTDYTAMAKVLMKAEHAAGILFLQGSVAHDRFWKERKGARTEACFDSAVSIDTAGKAKEWGTIVPTGTAKAFVSGRFTMDWWTACAPVVGKRLGAHVVAAIDAKTTKLPAKSFWADSEQLRLSESTARAYMAIIGFGGAAPDSFPSFYRKVLMLAETINNLPKRFKPRQGLTYRAASRMSPRVHSHGLSFSSRNFCHARPCAAAHSSPAMLPSRFCFCFFAGWRGHVGSRRALVGDQSGSGWLRWGCCAGDGRERPML
jgi:hypothetical protein